MQNVMHESLSCITLKELQLKSELTLGIGGSLAGLLETGLFAFLHTGIAGKQALLAKEGGVIAIDQHQRACHTEAHGFGLTGGAAAADQYADVVLCRFLAGGAKGAQNVIEIAEAREIDCAFLLVDDELAAAAG